MGLMNEVLLLSQNLRIDFLYSLKPGDANDTVSPVLREYRFNSVSSNTDAAVPEPANRNVDFAIVDSLEFGREIATAVSDRLQDSAESPDRKSSSASRHAPASLFP